jgi:hypothetical protein
MLAILKNTRVYAGVLTWVFTPMLLGGKIRNKKHPGAEFLQTKAHRMHPNNMISISKFKLDYNPDERVFYIRAGEVIPCPVCGGKLGKRGWPRRGLIRSNGKLYPLKVQRHICKDCKISHRELPDIIVPYKRLELEVIEQVINGEPTENGQDDRTIRHILTWWKAMVAYIEWYTAAIKEALGVSITILSPLTNLAEIVRALANSHKWPCTRLALLPDP